MNRATFVSEMRGKKMSSTYAINQFVFREKKNYTHICMIYLIIIIIIHLYKEYTAAASAYRTIVAPLTTRRLFLLEFFYTYPRASPVENSVTFRLFSFSGFGEI